VNFLVRFELSSDGMCLQKCCKKQQQKLKAFLILN